jgi:hypothetical protein
MTDPYTIAVSDWITITVNPSGHKKHVRRSAISAFGFDAHNLITYVEVNGRPINVNETEAEIAHLVGADVLQK